MTSIGETHTAIMDAIRADVERQFPDAFTEDTDAEIVIPRQSPERTVYVKLDVSSLAEAALAALSQPPQAVSLAPCPFCGGEAEIIHLDDGDNAGGSCVCCTSCQASGNVEFGRKENFVENWNRRASPADGVVVPRGEVTDEWADRFCEAINWSPDGQECKVVEGEMRCVNFRQIAKGHILAAIATGPEAASPALAATSVGTALCWISAKGLELIANGQPDIKAIVRGGSDDDYSTPLYATPPSTDADKLLIAREALEATKDRVLTWPIEDHETCMCGSPVEGHNIGSGHSPVSQGDHAISMIVEAINEALARLSTTEAGG